MTIYKSFKMADWAVLASVFCTLAAQANFLSTDDLIGYWQFDGDMIDTAPSYNTALSGLGHNGVYTGTAPVYVTGNSGLAIDFTGVEVGNFVRTGLPIYDGPKTLMLWVNTTVQLTDIDRTIWAGNEGGTDNRYYPGLRDRSGSFRPWLGGGTSNDRNGEFPATPNDGQWHMYVLTDTGNGGILSIYQDNHATPVFTLDYSGSTASIDPYLFTIGSGGGTGNPGFARAIIDDVSVFARILSTDEIAYIYNAGSLAAAIPEPATCGLVLSVLSLAFIFRARRRNR
jgi:hypothetical protein